MEAKAYVRARAHGVAHPGYSNGAVAANQKTYTNQMSVIMLSSLTRENYPKRITPPSRERHRPQLKDSASSKMDALRKPGRQNHGKLQAGPRFRSRK